jgi:hypothetical protein
MMNPENERFRFSAILRAMKRDTSNVRFAWVVKGSPGSHSMRTGRETAASASDVLWPSGFWVNSHGYCRVPGPRGSLTGCT